MPWVKVKKGAKTVYQAPPEAYPMLTVTYTPGPVPNWSIEYANFGPDAVSVSQVEHLMGL